MNREVKQSGHGFRKERLTSRKWLEYSSSADKVFCFPLSNSNPCIQASLIEAFRERQRRMWHRFSELLLIIGKKFG